MSNDTLCLPSPTEREEGEAVRILSPVIVEAHDTTFDSPGREARPYWKERFWHLGPVS